MKTETIIRRYTAEELSAMSLAELHRVALDDMRLLSNSPDVVFNMGVWVSMDGSEDPKCYVCLAGAVLYNHLGWRDHTSGVPGFASALNHLRCGEVYSAKQYMNDSFGYLDSELADRCRVGDDLMNRLNQPRFIIFPEPGDVDDFLAVHEELNAFLVDRQL